MYIRSPFVRENPHVLTKTIGGMEKVICISAAKVPIVKIWDPELELACDMNVNNTVALENTRMIRTYVEIDDRVRQLAMIVKYWTRRRIVNDAGMVAILRSPLPSAQTNAYFFPGLGGTLSSYTWICLVIAFLQLRNPPVLPALHQRPHQRLSAKDGVESSFADDLSQLRGFGDKNKSTLGQLLFDFFRFYAHEFDYDKHALSVRLGRLLTKKDKNWHHAINNRLCLEEPFNTSRNLGNTADEYSFKGLHLELRRAFDLISAAKLEECCAQYVFPKEEERVFTQTRKSQPVLMRSSSQTHNGRGGRGGYGRGGRHSNNFYRSNNSSRRASSSIGYDNGNAMFSPHVGQDLAWYTGAPYIPQDIMSAAWAMQAQQQDFRVQQLYQNQFLAQAYQQPQQQQQQSSQSQQQSSQSQQRSSQPQSQSTSSDRPRTNSFDNPPLTAPLRPDMLSPYGVPFPGQQYFPAVQSPTMFGAYQSTPSAAAGSSGEPRRSLQRAGAATEAGTSAAGSSLRSQSQPASRSIPTAQTNSGSLSSSGLTPPNGASSLPSRNNANGFPIPSFVADETEFDEGPIANGSGDSPPPPSEDGSHVSLYLGDASSPSRHATATANGIAFGDLHQPPQGRRRMSTDLPQAVLDKRMKRVSRSPSPAGHARAFSVGNPQPLSTSSKNASRPVVVSSSLLNPGTAAPPRQSAQQPTSEGRTAGEMSSQVEYGTDTDQSPVAPNVTAECASQSLPERPPIVVNGTNSGAATPTARATASAAANPATAGQANLTGLTDELSFRGRINMMSNGYYVAPYAYQQDPALASRYAHSTRQRGMPRHQNGVIAPLDLAVADYKASVGAGPMDLQNLSPVYEGKAPPSASGARKPNQSSKDDSQPRATEQHKAQAVEGSSSSKAKHDKVGDRTLELKQGSTASRHTQSKTGGHGGSQKAGQTGHEGQGSRTHMTGHGGGGPREVESRHARAGAANGEGGWQKAPGKHRKKGGDSKAQANGIGHGEKPPKHDHERKGG